MNITTKYNYSEILEGCGWQIPLPGVSIWVQAAGLAAVISFLITGSITVFSAFMIAYAQVMEQFYAVHINLAPYSNWQETGITYGVQAGIIFGAVALTLRLRAKNAASKPLNFQPMPAGASEALLFFGVAQEQTRAAANEAFASYSGTADQMQLR